MDIKGAYVTIKELLYTCEELVINDQKNQINLPANRALIVPDYQREFRWEEKQLLDLFNDFNKQNGYLGQIALINDARNNNDIYIVDGQQRITSIIILMSTLCRELKIFNDELNFKAFDLNLSQELAGNKKRLNFQANSFPEFQEFISGIYEIEDNDSILKHEYKHNDAFLQKDRYLNAINVFVNLIRAECDRFDTVPEKTNWLAEYLEKIKSTKISIVFIESESNFEGERVFLDVNEKGLKLDDEDILKAHYFKCISKRFGNIALDNWKEIKTNYFKLKPSISEKKITLSFLANYFLEISLTSNDNSFDPYDFDDKFRYKKDSVNQHICELFTGNDLYNTMLSLASFIDDINILLNMDSNSDAYTKFDDDGDNRRAIKSLISSIAKSNMRIVYISLIKYWILCNNSGTCLSKDDLLQIYAFYIICCISSRRKERKIFSKEFMHSKNMTDIAVSIFDIEKFLLQEIYESARALKGDQKKAEYLSYGIQKFYNEFNFDKTNKKWTLINQRDFLSDYSGDNQKQLKDHFLVQKADAIHINDDITIDSTGVLNKYKSRAYNFLYHVDDYANKDFVYRLDVINHQASEERKGNYKKYEKDYFNYLESQLYSFYKISPNDEDSWNLLLKSHNTTNQEEFEKLIQMILDDKIFVWHKTVCDHFRGLMEEN